MIIDTSVLVAILKNEPDAPAYIRAIRHATPPRISAATYLEVGIVADSSRDPELSRSVDDLIRATHIVVEPVTASQARIAREAYRDFGKRSGHPASLKLGDCFAYALAKDLGEPLLYQGDDFSHTDVRLALH